MFKLIIFLTPLFWVQLCRAQSDPSAWIPGKNSESLAYVEDSIIKKEVAQFSLKGAAMGGSNNAVKLFSVPPRVCHDTLFSFEAGTIIALEVFASITSTGTEANALIKDITLLFYKTFAVVPDSAIAGISYPKVCKPPTTGKKRPVFTNCKAFRSADKRRTYIYMLNGEGENRYEVTWVFQAKKYLTRIIDRV